MLTIAEAVKSRAHSEAFLTDHGISTDDAKGLAKDLHSTEGTVTPDCLLSHSAALRDDRARKIEASEADLAKRMQQLDMLRDSFHAHERLLAEFTFATQEG